MKVIFVISVVVASVSIVGAQQVKSGLPFLRLGAGADAIGRGDALVTDPSAAQAVFYNPAAIGDAPRASAMLMHLSSIADVNNNVLGANLPLGDWAVGFGLQSSSVSGVEVRDIATTQPLGTFTSLEGAVTLGAAYRASPEWSLGMNLKALVQKIYLDQTAGWAMDVGARYKPTGSPFAYGLVLQNVGHMDELHLASTTLPTLVRGAVSYSGMMDESNLLLYTAECVGEKVFSDGGVHVRVGGEIAYNNFLFARAGFKTGFESSLLTAGIGLRFRFVQLDYAMQPYAQSYGIGHAVSLNIGF